MTRYGGFVRRVVPAALLVALLAALPCAAGEALTLEDVVRLHVAGTSADDLVARIAAAEVDFDLSEEMLQELRYAGLPDVVIAAMQERQRTLHPPAADAHAPSGPAAAAPPLRLVLTRIDVADDASGPDGTLAPMHVFNIPPPALLHDADLSPEPITDLALWVGCETATHVPDHWRGETPLGRDFSHTPRHRLLAFLPGAVLDTTRFKRKRELGPIVADFRRLEWNLPDPGVLELSLPDSVDVDLDPDEPHDIVVGLAVAIADRWITVTAETMRDYRPADHDGRLEVDLKDGRYYQPGEMSVRLRGAVGSSAPGGD